MFQTFKGFHKWGSLQAMPSTPSHRSDARVNDARHPRGEKKVASKLKSLGNAARNNGRASDAEGPLEEPKFAQTPSRTLQVSERHNLALR